MDLRSPLALVVAVVLLGACVPERPASTLDEPVPAPREVEPAPEDPSDTLEDRTVEPEPGPVPEPAPAPEPAPFAGREYVEVDELLAALRDELPAIAASPEVRADFEALVAALSLDERGLELDALYLDYVRIKVAFEATRAGGLWGLAWDITNEQPNSEKIWAHWQTLDAAPVPATIAELPPLPTITAIAECDELSALFAYVAQRIGLSKPSQVGLFWPTGNHTVAVWTIDAKGDDPVRVVVPTSQVFLDEDQSLATDGFDPWTQRRIFDYRRADAPGELELPASLAARFVVEVRTHAPASQAALQARRNARERDQLDQL